MAVVEKPIENKIKLIATNEYQEYDPSKEVSCWVDIKLEAPIFEEEDNKRAAVDLVAVIDRSGSMGGGKLDLVKKTLHFVVSQLAASDRIALIVYDGNIDEIFPLTKITSTNKSQIENKIDSVQTGGSTNLCGGLLKGMQMVIERAGDKADVASVLLLTDGHANAGISSQEGILRAMKTPYDMGMMQQQMSPGLFSNTNIAMPLFPPQQPQMQQHMASPQQLQQAPPQQFQQAPPQQLQQAFPAPPPPAIIGGASPLEPADKKHPGDFEGTVYTFGFGNDHNASLLEEISNQGNGAYYYIDSQEKVPESFASCLGGLLSTVGQNITMTVEISNGCVVKEFTAKNKPKYNEGRTRAEVALGDLQSEETRDVLMELKLPVSPAGDVKYCSVALAYFNVITAVMETIKLDLTVARTNTGKPCVSNPTIDKERNRINITNAIKEARENASAGQFKKGRDILSACEKQVKSSATSEDPLCKAMLIDLADCLRGMEDEQSYAGYGGKRMANMAQNYCNQRANFVPDAMQSQNVMYQTKAKSAMMKKF
ncbi:hypothetical protein LOD99_7590 [Oopsacas minuta]|uniref:VWFA domain-containing protein n=1 Tax=Oopsacas minuta TaxID=111878 RepID=A0AAV7JPT0_9METZ|nr:hypothetical protein LOD99_7590 [Oopsacas minuta]